MPVALAPIIPQNFIIFKLYHGKNKTDEYNLIILLLFSAINFDDIAIRYSLSF